MEPVPRVTRRKTVARVTVNNATAKLAVNTRSRAKKQVVDDQPAQPIKSEAISPVEDWSRKTQMLPPTFESTRIELASTQEKRPASPEKKGYEDDVPKKDKERRDFAVQVSLCKNCSSGNISLYRFLKPFFMVFVLMIVTLYHKEIINLDSWKEYAASLNASSTMFARLKLEDYTDIFSVRNNENTS